MVFQRMKNLEIGMIKCSFISKKKLSESPKHVFITYEVSKECYEFVRVNYLHKKNLENSLDLLEFKRRVSENDYKALSCYVYGVWRIRNLCKHNEIRDTVRPRYIVPPFYRKNRYKVTLMYSRI